MGGETETQTQTQETAPWKPQQQYLTQAMSDAQKIYQSGSPSYYDKSTVADQSDLTKQSYSGAQNLSQMGAKDLQAAQDANNKILAGDYGDDVFKNIQSKVLPSVSAQFEGSGRYGANNSMTDATTSALTNAYAPVAASMSQQAIANQGALNQAQWANQQASAQAGAQKDAYNQSLTDADIQRFNYNQNLPQLKLDQYMKNISGNYGSSSSTSTPVQKPGLFQQLAGGALGLAGLFG